jgi:protein involved in polysaccharide export with SLBB domain
MRYKTGNIRMFKKIILLFVFFIFTSLQSQISNNLNVSGRSIQGIPENLLQAKQTLTKSGSFQNIENLDLNKYIVDAGDVLFAKVDVKGPNFINFNIPVTGEGYALLPQGKSIQVRGQILSRVLKSIKKKLQQIYKEAVIEVFLKQPRMVHINVNIAGIQNYGLEVPATFYITNIISMIPTDTSIIKTGVLSKRFISLFRKGRQKKIDLFRAYFYNDSSEQLYVENNDFYIIPLAEDITSLIYISGAVNRPGYYEFNAGDTFKDLLLFAGGLKSNADKYRVEIFRKTDNYNNFTLLPEDEWDKFQLKTGDRIYVRSNKNLEYDWRVEIQGEIKFPGEYSITDDSTTVYQLVQMAGGFTSRASLKRALIIRTKFIPEDKELERLKKLSPEEMSRIERSYFKIRSRQDIRKVVCDFERLFVKKILDEDVRLRDGDLIIIPPKNEVVIISGGVMNPGIQPFYKNLSYKEYIRLAGGFNTRAMKRKVKIIKPVQGLWLDAKDDIQINPGDIIFIPEKEERDWWELFKDSLTIVTQIGTLAVIILNLKKL